MRKIRMRKRLFVAAGIALLCSLNTKAQASVLTLYAFQDAEIRNASGSNYGTSQFLSGNSSSTNRDSFAFLQFDLASLIPSGSTIDSAAVSLYRTLPSGNNDFANSISLYGVNSTWSESSITGNNEPANSPTAAATIAAPGTTAGYLTWTGPGLTTLVQGWVNNAVANFGLVTSDLNYGNGSNGRYIQFYSSEAAAANVAPRLVVNYTSPVPNVVATPEPATMALFGIGLAGMMGLRRRKDLSA